MLTPPQRATNYVFDCGIGLLPLLHTQSHTHDDCELKHCVVAHARRLWESKVVQEEVALGGATAIHTDHAKVYQQAAKFDSQS